MKQIVVLLLGAVLLATPVGAVAKERKGCPPGLAKKSPSCVPPGLAKKGVTAEDWAARRGEDDENGHLDIGDRIERDDYIVLAEGDRVTIDGEEYVVVDVDHGIVLRRDDGWYRLPRVGDGSSYVRVGDALIRVDPETRAVIEIIQLADLILG